MTENWRVNTARFLALTALPTVPFLAAAGAALAGVILVTRICSRRRAATARSIVSATRSPLIVSPARVRPENAKDGMLLSSLFVPYRRTLVPPPGRGGAPGA